jgi:hypothetical protein
MNVICTDFHSTKAVKKEPWMTIDLIGFKEEWEKFRA